MSASESMGDESTPDRQARAEVVGGVLAAGLGTRMRPLTHSVPKPLLPFLNAPLVTYPLQYLADAGARRVGFNLHHLADSIPPVVNPIAARLGLDPSYAREWERLGTSGGIASIWKSLDRPEDATLVVFNGDTVMNLDLQRHLERHRESDALVTLVGTPPTSGRPANLKLDDEAQLAGIREARRPDAAGSDAGLRDCAFAGVHILSAEAASRLEAEPGDVVEELYEPLVEAGAAIEVSQREGFWASLENPELLLEVTRSILQRPREFDQAPMPESDEHIWVLDESEVADDVKLNAPVFIGQHVEVASGAELGPNAVIDGATVRSDVTVNDAIVYGAGEVEADRIRCVEVADQLARLAGADDAAESEDSDAKLEAEQDDEPS